MNMSLFKTIFNLSMSIFLASRDIHFAEADENIAATIQSDSAVDENIKIDLFELLSEINPPLLSIVSCDDNRTSLLYEDTRPNIRTLCPGSSMVLQCYDSKFSSPYGYAYLIYIEAKEVGNFSIIYYGQLENERIYLNYEERTNKLPMYGCKKRAKGISYSNSTFNFGIAFLDNEGERIFAPFAVIKYGKLFQRPRKAYHLVSPRSVGFQGKSHNIAFPYMSSCEMLTVPPHYVYGIYKTIEGNLMSFCPNCSEHSKLDTFYPHPVIPPVDLDSIGQSFSARNYVNTFPRYEVMKNGNLERVEEAIRDLANNLCEQVAVETLLSVGVIERNGQRLFLYEEGEIKRMSIPKHIIKIVTVETGKRVHIRVNNDPYYQTTDPFASDACLQSCLSFDWLKNIGLTLNAKDGLVCCTEVGDRTIN